MDGIVQFWDAQSSQADIEIVDVGAEVIHNIKKAVSRLHQDARIGSYCRNSLVSNTSTVHRWTETITTEDKHLESDEASGYQLQMPLKIPAIDGILVHCCTCCTE